LTGAAHSPLSQTSHITKDTSSINLSFFLIAYMAKTTGDIPAFRNLFQICPVTMYPEMLKT
jgi:hypothetical protein